MSRLVGKWEKKSEMAAHGQIGARSSTAKERHGQDDEVPIVYPLHVNKFVRRSSIATPVRPQTPLLRSTLDEETALHAPRPYRSIPALKSPPENLNVPAGQRSHYISPMAHLHGTKKRCVRHGRHDHVRQDRYRKKEAFKGTRDMIAKSRSGSYIPTGQMKRRQMEATSPWVTTMDLFCGGHDMLMDDADACPDCMQELDIKKREAYGQPEPRTMGRSTLHRSTRDADGSNYTVQRHADGPGRQLFPPASHCYITDLSPVSEPDRRSRRLSPPATPTRVATGDRGYGRAWQESVYEHNHPDRSARGIVGPKESSESSETTPDTDYLQDLVYDSIGPPRMMKQSRRFATAADDIDGFVVSRKLRDGVNAVIVEHQGQLQRVILSPRQDASKLERLYQLSRELANVANTLAFTSAKRGNPAPVNPVQRSVVIDRDPLPPQTQQRTPRDNSSIPDLLSLIDQAAGEIRFNSNKISDQFVNQRRQSLAAAVGREQSLMNSDEVHETLFDMPGPAEQIAHRQGMEEALDAARGHMETAKKNQSAPDSSKQQSAAGKPAVGSNRPKTRERAALNVRQEAANRTTLPSNQQATKPQSQTMQDKAMQTPSTVKDQSSSKSTRPIPAVITTRPTRKEPTPQTESPNVSSAQNAPPAPSGVRPTIEVQQPAPVVPTPTPTPRALPPATPQAQPEHHSYFHDLLAYNPFHRRTPQPPLPPDPTGDSFEAMNPLVAASKAAIPSPITKQPSPYRHAPAVPTDLFSAQHTDPGVREQAQMVRAAMRMERGKTVQEAAALEREARRLRRESLVGSAAAAAAPGAGAAQGKGKAPVKKGWLH